MYSPLKAVNNNIPSSPKEKPFYPAANVASSWSPVENITLLSTNRATSEFILSVVSVQSGSNFSLLLKLLNKLNASFSFPLDHHKGSKAKPNKN